MTYNKAYYDPTSKRLNAMKRFCIHGILNGFPDGSNIECLKKKQNAPRPSEHPPVKGEKNSKRLGGVKEGCKYKKNSSWHLNGFPDGNNIG